MNIRYETKKIIESLQSDVIEAKNNKNYYKHVFDNLFEDVPNDTTTTDFIDTYTEELNHNEITDPEQITHALDQIASENYYESEEVYEDTKKTLNDFLALQVTMSKRKLY